MSDAIIYAKNKNGQEIEIKIFNFSTVEIPMIANINPATIISKGSFSLSSHDEISMLDDKNCIDGSRRIKFEENGKIFEYRRVQLNIGFSFSNGVSKWTASFATTEKHQIC
jgi:hypothetical protein